MTQFAAMNSNRIGTAMPAVPDGRRAGLSVLSVRTHRVFRT